MIQENLIKYVAVFGLSMVIVILLTPLFIKLAPRIGLMDVPDERCVHKNITPVGGGLVVFIAFNISCYLFYHYLGGNLDGLVNNNWWFDFFIASSILLIVGLIDDCFGMRPLVKLAGQIAACTTLYVLSDYHVNLLNVDFGFWGGLIFVLIWTVAIINAFNLIDGLDGLCSGLAMISAIGLAAIFILRGTSGDALVCIALIGACFGFLFYNFHPAKVFLGDTGSMFLGFSLASIGLYAGGKGSFLIILAAPFFIAGIPVTDTLLAIWRRSMRKAIAERQGLPAVKVMQPDKEHLHHRLLNHGFKQHHVALVLYAINIVIICIGVLVMVLKERMLGMLLIIGLFTIYLFVKYVLHIELWETHRLIRLADKTPGLTRLSMIFYPAFDLLWMSMAVWSANYIASYGNIPVHGFMDWAAQFLLWENPIILLLLYFKLYFKVWQSSFFKDYLYLILAILLGSVVSLALLLTLNEGNNVLFSINVMALFVLFASLGVVGVRVVHYFIRAWAADNANNDNARHIIIYGAGAYGVLYLHECYLKNTSDPGTINIIGFMEDVLYIKNDHVYGKTVLGGMNELSSILTDHTVDEIVVTGDVSDDVCSQLKNIINNTSIKLLKWDTLATHMV